MGLAVGVLAIGAAGCDTEVGKDDSGAQAPPPPTTAEAPAPTSTYTLASGGKAIVDSAGKRFPIDAKLVVGYLDSAALNGEHVDVSGWAAPADLSRPADTVVAIAGGKSVATIAPSGDRPDLVDGYDRPGLAKAGFAMSIPTSALDCAAPDQGLETFAISGNAAGRLDWLSDVPGRVAEACQ